LEKGKEEKKKSKIGIHQYEGRGGEGSVGKEGEGKIDGSGNRKRQPK